MSGFGIDGILKKTGAGLRVKTTDMSTKTGFLKKGKKCELLQGHGRAFEHRDSILYRVGERYRE